MRLITRIIFVSYIDVSGNVQYSTYRVQLGKTECHGFVLKVKTMWMSIVHFV